MATKTEVSYADHSWSPWIGCNHVSPGCLNCCAESLMDNYLHKAHWGDHPRVGMAENYWKQPLVWNKTPTPQRVLVLLCDPFEDNPQVANWRARFFRLMEETPNLTWLLLTKRPENISNLGTEAAGRIFDLWLDDYPNVKLGVSVENQCFASERIGEMLKNAYSFFVSAAPMLGPIDLLRAAGKYAGYFNRLSTCKWVICEGESGRKYRTLNIADAESLRAQCRELGIPFYMKQDSGLKPGRQGRLPDDLWNCKEFPR